jgi:hypothetical protein
MDNRKETVILFRGQIESLLCLSSLKDVKTILRAIVLYGMDNETPEIPEHLTFGWLWFKNTIDSHREQYAAKCDRNRNSANKRWGNGDDIPMDANGCERIKIMRMDANACERMQTHKNHAYNDNDNDLNKECILSRTCAIEAERIANLYPRAKIGNWQKTVNSVLNAIQREFDRGNSVNDAVALVELGTREYAKAAEKIKHKRFIFPATKFFDDGIYNNDPETWDFSEENNNKGVKSDSSYEYQSQLD